MRQNAFAAGLRHGHGWGAYSSSQTSLLDLGNRQMKRRLGMARSRKCRSGKGRKKGREMEYRGGEFLNGL